MLCGWEGNRKSGVIVLAMQGVKDSSCLSTDWLNGLRQGDEHLSTPE